MQLKIKALLHDIQEAIDLIARFGASRSFQTSADDPMIRSAIERQFVTIGEALNQITRLDPAIAMEINEHQRIIGLRNILVHSYAKIDDRVIWSIVEDKLPRLCCDVQVLLGNG